MANKWTSDQQAVINHRGTNLLVAAAAGSGKTAVLIERIIRLILDEKHPIDIDRLLVVTFTKAAAGEMRERVGFAIEKELEKNPNNTRLQRQRMLLNKADITTIDSFCNSVMRTNFHAIDIDPSLRIGDSAEIEILKADTIEEFFEKKYKEKDKNFLKLVDTYASKNSDDGLVDLIFKISGFVDSTPYPDEWLDMAAELFNPDFKDRDYYIKKIILPQFEEILIEGDAKLLQLDVLISELESYGVFEKSYDFMKEFEDKLKIFLDKIRVFFYDKRDESELEDIVDMVSSGYVDNDSRAPSVRKSKENEYCIKEYKSIKEDFDSIKADIKKYIGDLRIDIEILEMEDKIIYPYMRALSDIVKEFRSYYGNKKIQKSIAEFSDVEHYALEILTEKLDDGSIVASDIARSYQERYEEVFTDEYQDSNMVQESILDMVSRKDRPNRFMVGDVKQSIYMFRQAMPKIFMDKYKSYDIELDRESEGRKILLYKNFRSRKEVLEACNHLFKEIMTARTGDLDYTDEERLNPGAEFKDIDIENGHAGGPVEVYLIDDKKQVGSDELGILGEREYVNYENVEEIQDIEKFRVESMQIANIIDDLVRPTGGDRSRFMVYDKDLEEYRLPTYGDIVVLMRSTKSRGPILEEILLNRQIPSYSESGGGYFSTIEVTTIINLLRVIDNPIQDIALIATMRSPIFAFTDGELATIRLSDKDGNYYEAIKKFIEDGEADFDLKNKILEFLDKLDSYRQDAFLLPIDEFIWKIYKDTGYYVYVGDLAMGEVRQANLILLYEKAKSYESGSYRGLFNFLNYVEKLKLASQEPKEAVVLAEDADLVRIMTIHKSKGLEFPIVILANTAGEFYLKSDSSVLDLDYQMGYGPKYIDINNKISYRTTVMKMMAKNRIRSMKAEEMRMLYVAMTRAKEKLIFTGMCKDLSKSMDKWSQVQRDLDGNIHSSEIMRSMSYLDWIMPTIINLAPRDSYIDVRGQEATFVGYKDCKWDIKTTNRMNVGLEYMDRVKKVSSSDDNFISTASDRVDVGDMKKTEDPSEEISQEAVDYLAIKEINEFEYAYKDSAGKPSSISVTDIKKVVFDMQEDYMHENLLDDNLQVENTGYKDKENYRFEDLGTPSFIHQGKIKKSYKANEKGTIFHLVMQMLDFMAFEKFIINKQLSFEGLEFSNSKDKEIKKEIKRQIDDMVKRKVIIDEEAKTVNISWIVRFIKSDIFAQIMDAEKRKTIHKEIAINYSIRVKDIYRDEDIDDKETMMMVGIIDLFFEMNNGDIVLLDYKTDHVGEKPLEDMVKRYQVQMDLYKQAIEGISGKKVVKKYLYMFSVGKLLEC